MGGLLRTASFVAYKIEVLVIRADIGCSISKHLGHVGTTKDHPNCVLLNTMTIDRLYDYPIVSSCPYFQKSRAIHRRHSVFRIQTAAPGKLVS